jgi:predicted class III extradiol MEMO1 family dioxygenase
MKIKYHEGIYYPSDRTELEELTKVDDIKDAASVIIVPHMALSLASPLLKRAFSHFGSPDRVIILSPLHSGRLESDGESCFFEGEENRELGLITLGAKRAEYYAEEEAGAEILIPFINKRAPFAIIYTDIRTARESRVLASFLKENSTSETLFIISTNFSPACTRIEEADEWLERGTAALQNGENVLDTMNRHLTYLCARGAVDAVDRVVSGEWILEESEKGKTTAHAVMWKRK